MYSSLAAVAKTTELPTCDVIAPLASLASLPVDQVVVEEEVTAEMECSFGEEAVGVVVEIVREGMEEKEDSRALFKVRKDNMVVVTVVVVAVVVAVYTPIKCECRFGASKLTLLRHHDPPPARGEHD
jgi:hypothetical protein